MSLEVAVSCSGRSAKGMAATTELSGGDPLKQLVREDVEGKELEEWMVVSVDRVL